MDPDGNGFIEWVDFKRSFRQVRVRQVDLEHFIDVLAHHLDTKQIELAASKKGHVIVHHLASLHDVDTRAVPPR